MAKEQKQEQNPPPVPDVPEAAGPPKSYRLYISLGFVSLILFQMILLFLLLPAKPPPSNRGITVGEDFKSNVGEPQSVIRSDPTVEIQIGDRNTFSIKDTRGDGVETFSLEMHVVIRERDKRSFDRRHERCTIEVIDRANGVLRASSTDERKEAGNTAIKERVKREINLVLGTPWVQQVLFTRVVHEVN